jgi:hypothetical protein
MVRIELATSIDAPIDRCFNLARSIDLELASAEGLDAIAGVTSGLIGPDEQVTWRSRHFGFVVRHTSLITAYEFPRYFQDSMLEGLFRSYCHDHYFEVEQRCTLMKDAVRFSAPYGPLGRVAELLSLERHMRKLLAQRNLSIKQAAEGNGYRKYLGESVDI